MAKAAGRPRKAGRRWSVLQGELVEVRQLAQWLRDQIDVAGLSLRALEQHRTIPHSRDAISRMLSGRERPDLIFVRALITVCSPADPRSRHVLIAKAEQLWRAADPATARRYQPPPPARLPGAASAEVVLAQAEQNYADAQRQVEKNQQIINSLMYVLGQFNNAMTVLTRERDTLQAQAGRQQAALADAERELARLRDVEQRLQATEESLFTAQNQLDEAHDHLAVAQRLRSEATIQLRNAQRQPPTDDTTQATSLPVLMGQDDQALARALLDNIQDVLDQDADDLDRLRDQLVQHPASPPDRQPATTRDNLPANTDNIPPSTGLHGPERGEKADAAEGPLNATKAWSGAFRTLREAAGSPPAKWIQHQCAAQNPPVKVSLSSLSDWHSGQAVPANLQTAQAIVAVLAGLARRRTPSFVAPDETWWEQTWQQARQQRRRKRSRPPQQAQQPGARTTSGASRRVAPKLPAFSLWSPGAEEDGEPLEGHTARIWSVAFSPDGSLLASASADDTVRLWNVATHALLDRPLTGHADEVNTVVFSPDGTLLATASTDTTVRLWNVATRTPLGRPLTGHTSAVRSVAFSPDGKTLATTSSDGTVRLWDVATRTPSGPPFGFADPLWSVAFSPDGTLLAIAGQDTTVELWDVATRTSSGPAFTRHNSIVWSVAFSPDGTLLATAGQDTTVELWDVATRKRIDELLNIEEEAINTVAFSPDGTLLATGSDDYMVQLWRPRIRR